MKKYLVGLVSVMLICLPTMSVAAEFTHTVFLEEGTTTWCPNCPVAAEALHEIYNSSTYPFYYVALVADMNSVAQKRFSQYGGRAIPTVWFDGGFSQQVGTGGLAQAISDYSAAIEEAGSRTIHPLEVTTTVVGHDDAKLDITVTVKNTGNGLYIGMLKSYVTEIVSRWNNQQGDAYHFGFLDYAFQKIVIVGGGKTKTFTTTWDGTAQHGNLTFPDIVDNNIMVISAVSHWVPHYVPAEEYVKTHFAFFVDQAGAGTPT
jgi:hypothetical protein